MINRQDKLEWIRRKLGFEGLFVVDPQERSGSLAMLWKDMDQVKLMDFSQNRIDVTIFVDGMEQWRLTGVYVEPNRA